MTILRRVHTRPRHVKRTVLAVVEGKTEKAFLRYLYEVYGRGQIKGKRSIRIEDAHGGSPGRIVREALKLHPRRFDVAFIFMDTDLPMPEEEAHLANDFRLELAGSAPHCIEGMFISILEPTLDITRWSSRDCKNHFESKILSHHSKLIPERYAKIFPKQLLDKLRQEHPVFRRLCFLMFEA